MGRGGVEVGGKGRNRCVGQKGGVDMAGKKVE